MSTWPHMDDQPPEPRTPDATIRLGHDWQYEATTDGTIRLTARRTGMVVELGCDDLETWFEFATEVAQAGAAHAALDRYAQEAARRAGFDVFGMFAQAAKDAERIG